MLLIMFKLLQIVKPLKALKLVTSDNTVLTAERFVKTF